MPKKTRSLALASLVTPHGTLGADPGDGIVAIGGKPDIDTSISSLCDVIAALSPDALQALFNASRRCPTVTRQRRAGRGRGSPGSGL